MTTPPEPPSVTLRYLTAAGAGALCTAVVYFIPALHTVPYLPMFAAVALAARFWGAGPAVITTVVSALAVDYFVFPPRFAWSLAPVDLVRTFGFIAVCLIVTNIARLRTNAEQRLISALNETNQALVAERAVRESLQTAQEVGRVAAWTVDVKSGKLTWAANAQSVFQGSTLVNSVEEFFTRVHPDDAAALREQVPLMAKQVLSLQYRVLDDQGKARWYHTRCQPMQEGHEQVERVIGATVDISDMKEAQHALIRSEKLAAAGRIAASIAHEINNPLNSVGNLIYLAQSHGELPLEAREWLAQANEELMRTARIAQQTLGFYKDTSEPSLLDVHALVQEVVRFYSAQAKRRRVQVDVSGGPVWVYVKAGELRQALSNILINAVDASRETSQIAITVFGDNRRATIRVRDHGPGVPETLRERIFEPFFTTKKDVGTGLGLWTTRQLLRAAGGDVELAKTDDGAEFVLWLPRSEELDASAD